MVDPVCAQLLEQIGKADTIGKLCSLRKQLHPAVELYLNWVSTSPAEHTVARQIVELNRVHDALIKRVITLVEQHLAHSGIGLPPVPYVYVLFGSGGRKEQTLSSDQDSGLIYSDPEDRDGKERAVQYFEMMSSLAVEWLAELGYPPCEGNVVSANTEWRMSLSDWRSKLKNWFAVGDWESIRYLLIVADSRSIHGDTELLSALKEQYTSEVLFNPLIAQQMLSNTLRHKVLIGAFGQLLKEQYGPESGSVDIKYGAYIPLVNAIRLLAIQSGVESTATLERIRDLTAEGIFLQEQADTYVAAFELILRLRLQITGLNGKLAGSKLDKILVTELKQGLKIVKKLQRIVRKRTEGSLWTVEGKQ